jgi:acetyl esterase/lipase
MASAMQDAAARTYIASQRNTSVGGVPVLVSVPKGVLEGAPADTRVVVYLHGALREALPRARRRARACACVHCRPANDRMWGLAGQQCSWAAQCALLPQCSVRLHCAQTCRTSLLRVRMHMRMRMHMHSATSAAHTLPGCRMRARPRQRVNAPGGGYTVGSCHYQLSTVGPTAAAAQLVVMCPEYRLAPEHPFPAGLNDALTMWVRPCLWLCRRCRPPRRHTRLRSTRSSAASHTTPQLTLQRAPPAPRRPRPARARRARYKSLLSEGYRPGNIVLLGDSAGGGLVAAMAVQLAREGVGLPAALGMFSPWADLERGGDTGVTMIGVDPLLATLAPPNQSTDAMPSQYVGGDTSKFADPLVSPLRADYVALFANGTLPPTLIQVGLRELLLSHAVLLYHKMALAAPTPGHVVISPYEGMWHVFQMFNDVPEAQAAAREMAAYFSRALSGGICT